MHHLTAGCWLLFHEIAGLTSKYHHWFIVKMRHSKHSFRYSTCTSFRDGRVKLRHGHMLLDLNRRSQGLAVAWYFLRTVIKWTRNQKVEKSFCLNSWTMSCVLTWPNQSEKYKKMNIYNRRLYIIPLFYMGSSCTLCNCA